MERPKLQGQYKEMPIDLETPGGRETLAWRPTWAAPVLTEGDLHLWRIPTDTRGAGEGPRLDTDLALLGRDQRVRAARMTLETARRRYVRAQAGLRRVLALYLDAPPASLEFQHGPAGKPALRAGPAGFEFNLTTAGDLALAAISQGGPVGVDCERIAPRRGLRGIARRMFEPAQADAIAALPEDGLLEAFYRAWTALEADAKWDGRGLFRPRPPGHPPPEVRHWVPAPGHIAAVARVPLPPLAQWQTLELGDGPAG
jgi:4'-phosphopantetheinyl transferase